MCGIILSYNRKGKRGWVRNSPSLDNINCKKTITINDIQIICTQCNSMNGSMNNKEFIEYCKNISNRSETL